MMLTKMKAMAQKTMTDANNLNNRSMNLISFAYEKTIEAAKQAKNTIQDVNPTNKLIQNNTYIAWENRCIQLVHDCFRDPNVLTDAIKESDFLKMDKTASNIQTQLKLSKENINSNTPNTEGDLYYRKEPKRLDNELNSCNIDHTSHTGYDKVRYAATIMHAIAQSGYMELFTENHEQVQEARNFEQSLRSNILPILMNIKITEDQIKQLSTPEVYKQITKEPLNPSSFITTNITTKATLLSQETTELNNQLNNQLKSLLLAAINNKNRMQVSPALDSVIHEIIESEHSSMIHHNLSLDDLELTTHETDESKTLEQEKSPDQLVHLDNTTDNEQNRHPAFEMTVIRAKAEIYAQDGSEITTDVDPRLRGDDILGTDNSDEIIDINLDKLRQYYSLNKVETMSQPPSIEEEIYPRHQLATAGILLITASASLALISFTCGMPLIVCGLAIGTTLIKAAMGVSMGVGIACVLSSLLPDRFFKPNDFFDTDDKNKTPTNQQTTKYTHLEYCFKTNEYKPITQEEVASDHPFSV